MLPHAYTFRRALRAVRTVAPFVALLAAACGGGGGGDVTPPPPSNAVVTFNVAAQFVVAPTSTGLSLRATPAYELAAGGTRALPAPSAVTLASAAAQTVPVPVDITTCLNDPARAGATTTGTPSCRVVVELSLLSGSRVLDTQTSGTFVVARGSASPTQAVTFAEITGVRVTSAAGAVLADAAPVRAEVGQTVTLGAAALRADATTTVGRTVTWASDNPAVATVNASTGVISGVTPGTARITASVGGVTSSVVVTVVAAPAAVAVTSSGGAGSGTVTSAPAGLTCRVLTGTAGSTCSAAFASDQAVVLTAAPDAGSAFAGWGGDCAAAGSALQCTLPASGGAPRAVTVRFNALRALAVTIAGSGAGTVTSTPAGINCSQNGAAGCTGSFADGATVTLSAAPDVNSTFGGWSGACTGTGTCTVTLSQAAAVTATFNIRPNPVPFNVTVNSSAGEYRIDLVYDLYVNGVLNSTRGRLTTVLTSAGAQPTLTLDADLGSQVTLSLRPSSSGPNGAGRVVSLGGVCAGATVSATGETNCTFTQARNASVVVNLAP